MTAVADPEPHMNLCDANAKAENLATYLCHLVMWWAQSKGLTNKALASRSGLHTTTIERLKHRRVKNYPSLLNFVKLAAAADLEIMLVRAQHDMPLDPNDDPAPPPYYNTGTEGTVRWIP